MSLAAGDIKTAVQKMRLKGLAVPKDYIANFDKAFLTFQFQVIYCPKDKKLRHLNDPEDSLHADSLKEHKDLSFLGKILDEEITEKIVKGEIDPISHKVLKIDFTSELLIRNVSKIQTKGKRDRLSITSNRKEGK